LLFSSLNFISSIFKALCLPEQQLLILERGRGVPGQCCDKFKCVNEGDEIEGLFLESSSNSGCRYGGIFLI